MAQSDFPVENLFLSIMVTLGGGGVLLPPPLRKHDRGPRSQAKTAVQRPPRARTRPCMRVTHVTARPGMTLLAMAEHHIRTSSMGFQCVVQCCYECTITDMNEPLFPCTNALQTPNPPFWTTKTAVPKFPQNGGCAHPVLRQGRACARGGGGFGCRPFQFKPAQS